MRAGGGESAPCDRDISSIDSFSILHSFDLFLFILSLYLL
jgi:hypothetical protein